jgi:glycosyltransferase involved in cell wall biosynthesis
MDRLISVVIPTFNRKALTDRAVESVVPSCPDLFEIVVVDDCGATPYSYEQDHNSSGVPVLTFRTPINGGPGRARKLGVEKANGSVIAFLDSDDEFDSGWADAVVSEVSELGSRSRDVLFIAGNVAGGSRVQCRCIQFLGSLPRQWQRVFVRLTAIAFNPFYIQAVAISKQLCSFSDSLRYSEDYFTNAMAIFKARKVSVLPIIATRLSRFPGMPGGLTESRREMWRGEFKVRKGILLNPVIPVPYRVLVPLGMAYAASRNLFRMIVGERREVIAQ